MTVYVDELVFPFRGEYWCHMWSDNEKELHEMAREIGLKKFWFQCQNPRFRHYDLSPKMKVAAVHAGAVEITCKEMVVKSYESWMEKKMQEAEENEDTLSYNKLWNELNRHLESLGVNND